MKWAERYPCIGEDTASTAFDRHYVYHTAWAARVLAKIKPELHVDFSSSLYFVSIVSAFLRVDHYDYRPPVLALTGLHVGQADLLNLPFGCESIASLSCMHVLEHVGLGRYGDALNTNGDKEAARELTRVLQPGGILLVAVPVGRPRTCFNAHRIYSFSHVEQMFASLQLKEYALIPDAASDGGLVYGADAHNTDRQSYGCGCFAFSK